MNQKVIDQFNAATAANDAALEKAMAADFPWTWFFERTRAKVYASGMLPERGYLMVLPRYSESAHQVTMDMMASIESVGDAHTYVGWCEPWRDTDLERWKTVLCSMTCTMFDTGVIASFTRAPKGEQDPIERNGGYSLWGDVGFLGIREKALGMIREVAGEEGTRLAGEIGDCACLHLYADLRNTERMFKELQDQRMLYVEGACKGAYVAGAVFGEVMAGRN